MLFDILKLHKESDVDPKSIILASGEHLKSNLNSIIKKINKKYTNQEIINKICSNNSINIKIKSNDIKIGIQLNKNIKKRNITKTKASELIKISGQDMNKILNNNYFPSCQKLKRIERNLVKLNNIEINCNKNDFCLQKLSLIHKTIYSKSNEIPLFVIKDLLDIWKPSNPEEFIKTKNNILRSIEYLRCNQQASEKTKCYHKLTPELSKIMGSFCADGNLSDSHMIRWEEEHQSNMLALKKWINNCFRNVEVKPEKRDRNSFTIKFRNKIMSRYITEFFKIAPGNKTYTVRIPEIIRDSNHKIKKAFLVGFMTFEASASSDGSISLGLCNRQLRDDVARFLVEDELEITQYTTKKKEGNITHCLITKNNTELSQKQKFKTYFEKNTIKWFKMLDFEKGFPDKPINKQDAINKLRLFFYKNKYVEIENILNKCEKLESFDIYDLLKEINYPRGSLTKYMSFLCKAKILEKTRKKSSNYIFNNEITEWRLPTTKFHRTKDLTFPKVYPD